MLEVAFFCAALIILCFGVQELRMVWGFWSYNAKPVAPSTNRAIRHEGAVPSILVQLPIFNEPEVVEPLLTAVSKLNYPSDRFRVQILDDSNDSSTRRIEATLAAMDPEDARKFRHIRRTNRSGFKAGALQNGLEQDGSEFVAIFDADFLPPPDFLRHALIEGFVFDDPHVAFVQGRWTHYNADENALARIQSILIDRHFLVQKPFQIIKGDDITFNGSAGIWRRMAIDEAGGWTSRTLCEDLDLSYRAALKGMIGRYDVELVCPNELPASIQAFKLQQRRWAKGTAQCMSALLPSIATHGGPERRMNNIFAISGYLIHPILLFYTICWPLLVLGGTDLRFLWICQLALMLGNVAAVAAFATTYSVRRDGTGRMRAARDVLFSTAFGISLMVNNSVAFLSGLCGSRGVFERTPKTGRATAALPAATLPSLRLNWIVIAEAVLSAYALSASVVMVLAGHPLEAQQTFLFGTLMLGLVGLQVTTAMKPMFGRLSKLRTATTAT